MGKTGSFIKLDRGLKNNPIWLEKPFSKGQAWVDILILAQGVDKQNVYRGKVQTLERGHVYTSLIFLANRWGWSRARVYRFLEELTFAKMITIDGWEKGETTNDTKNETIKRTINKTKNGTIITVENWEVYQDSVTNNDTNNETEKSTNRVQKTRHTRERQIKKKKDKENNPPKSPKGDLLPSGEKQWDNLHAETMMPRDMGTYEDIPLVYRDGTYQSFKTWEEYWDWSNQ